MPQSLVSGGLGSFAPGLSLAGLLGSDVLARFGAVRIDYVNETLSIEAPESNTSPNSVVATNKPPSAFDLVGVPRVTVGMDVIAADTTVTAVAGLNIKGRLYFFIVDTGAGFLSVSPQLAAAVHLRVQKHLRLTSTNCFAIIPVYRGGRGWRLGTLGLVRQTILGVPTGLGPFGLLGSTVLGRYDDLVVDYGSGQLLLETAGN